MLQMGQYPEQKFRPHLETFRGVGGGGKERGKPERRQFRCKCLAWRNLCGPFFYTAMVMVLMIALYFQINQQSPVYCLQTRFINA